MQDRVYPELASACPWSSRLHLSRLILTAVDSGAYSDLTRSLRCWIACDCRQRRTQYTHFLPLGRLLMGWSAILFADTRIGQRTRAGICSLHSGSANAATEIKSESIAEDPWLTGRQGLGGVRFFFAILEKNNERELLDRKADAVSQRCFYGL